MSKVRCKSNANWEIYFHSHSPPEVFVCGCWCSQRGQKLSRWLLNLGILKPCELGNTHVGLYAGLPEVSVKPADSECCCWRLSPAQTPTPICGDCYSLAFFWFTYLWMPAVLKLEFKNERFLSFSTVFSVIQVLVLKYQPVRKMLSVFAKAGFELCINWILTCLKQTKSHSFVEIWQP